mgnify:CR=1 FL=1
MQAEAKVGKPTSTFKFIRNINIGDIHRGIVIKKRAREVFIEIPNLGVGRVYGVEYIKAKDIIQKISEGSEVVVKIIGLDDGYGNFELELQDIEAISVWMKAKELMQNKEVIELEIKEANKGGLLVDFYGVKGFIPVSQLAPENYPRVGENNKQEILKHLNNFVGKKMKLCIISADPSSQKLIFSERAARLDEFQKALAQYKVGQIVEVEVLGNSKFGVFVRVHYDPPIDGLIHVTEIPERLRNLEENFKKGDKIKAKIIKLEADRVTLTLKGLEEDPWLTFAEKYKVQDVVKGTVISKSEFFASVNIEGVTGVVLENFENLEINKEYEFIIEQLDPDNKKLILKVKENESTKSNY